MAKRNLINGISKDAMENWKNITASMADIKMQYIQLGYHLQQCKQAKFYLEFGFDCFDDFVNDKFGLDKGTVSRCINVSEHYCIRKNGSVEIADDFKLYSYSQLVEMLPLFDEGYCDRINPNMSVREIRELKKSLLPVKKKDVVVEAVKTKKDVATSQPQKIDVDKAKVFSLNNELFGTMGHDEAIAHIKHAYSVINLVDVRMLKADYDKYANYIDAINVAFEALIKALDK